MNEQNITEWVHRAQAMEAVASLRSSVNVIHHTHKKSRGTIIMEIAEHLCPAFMRFFKDRRDVNGTLFQPAHVRAIALNYAEYLVKAEEHPTASAS